MVRYVERIPTSRWIGRPGYFATAVGMGVCRNCQVFGSLNIIHLEIATIGEKGKGLGRRSRKTSLGNGIFPPGYVEIKNGNGGRLHCRNGSLAGVVSVFPDCGNKGVRRDEAMASAVGPG